MEEKLASLDSRPPVLGMMGAKELSARLGVHYVTVLKALGSGRIRGIRVGKKWKIPEDEVRRVLREGF